MSEGDDLYRAVLDSPEDDAPRLIYADWLDEHGRPDRAEFIRVQCAMDRIPPGTAAFDNALLMRGLQNEFHHLHSFCCMVPTREQAQVPVGMGK